MKLSQDNQPKPTGPQSQVPGTLWGAVHRRSDIIQYRLSPPSTTHPGPPTSVIFALVSESQTLIPDG